MIFLIFGVWALGAGIFVTNILQRNPMFKAVRSGDTGRVGELLAHQPWLVRSRSLGGEFPLHLAVRAGNNDMVVMLLRAGADPNAKDLSQITALHLAAADGNAQVAGSLVKAGADVNAVGFRHRETPLHVAAFHGRRSLVELLLTNGANPNALDLLQKTPLQLAQENHQTDVVVLLRSHSSGITGRPGS